MTGGSDTPRRTGDSIAIEGGYQHRARREGFIVQRFWHAEKERVIRKYAAPLPGERVIDVGCGSGWISDFLASFGAQTTGIDANLSAIEYARAEFARPNLEFRHGLVEDLDFPAGSVDRVYCLEVIEHLFAEQVRALLADFHRLARPGATLFVTTPNYRGTWPLIEKTMDRLRLAPPLAEHQHVTRFHAGRLRAILREAGWDVERLTTFSTFAPFASVLGWPIAAFVARGEDRLALPFGNILLALARKP